MYTVSDMSRADERNSSRLMTLALTAITLLAAIVRLRGLDAQGITLDEGFSVFLARAPFTEFARTLCRSELNMALYYLLLRAWILLGQSEWTIRCLGVLLSIATVPVLYLLGRRLFNPCTGLIAAVLFALQPYQVLLAQNARSYPLTILLVCLSSLVFLRALDKPTWLTWLAWAVLSAAAVYSHFFAVLVIAAQVVSLLFLRPQAISRKQVGFAVGLLAFLLTPCALFLFTHDSATNLAWVPPLNLQQMRWLLYSLTLGKARSLLYVLLWCVALWVAAREKDAESRWPYVFMSLWLLLPTTLTILASLRHPALVERFLSVCLPASVLLAAVGIVELAKFSRCVALAAFALIIVYSGLAIRFYNRHPEFDEGWRQSSRLILRDLHAGDLVIAEGMKGLAFDYYRDSSNGELGVSQRLDSFSLPLPSPLPANIWILGWVRSNPTAPGASPRTDAEAVRVFWEAHKNDYCPASPVGEAGVTRVWHFRLCSPGERPPPTAR